jgi:uncharacterized protein
MKSHCMRVATATMVAVAAAAAQGPQPAPATDTARTYTVFLRSQQIGQESVSVVRSSDGWTISGSGRLGAPLGITTRSAEVVYDTEWRPRSLTLDVTQGNGELTIKTTFADGEAVSQIALGDTSSTRTDAVARDTIVAPNAFLGSYAALARRLVGQPVGATFRAYIVPQAEVSIRLDGVFPERIETAREAIAATRYALIFTSPPPAGAQQVSVWADSEGALLRMSVPAQMLEVAREDVASAATRTTAFSLPGDETVRIPAAGFGLAASVTKPEGAKGPLPAVVLIGGSGPLERDGFAAGIPVLGQIASDLVDAGFLVVRYDKRGVGQSGGRPETSTIADYAEDVRAIVGWLLKERRDVDDDRIALVGHGEGAWVAMLAAARDRRIAAVALVAGASTTGGALLLEQQRHLLERMKLPDAEKQAKVELQERINAAALKGEGWDGLPEAARRAADNPMFQSFLAFDPERVMRDVRQPVLVVQGELDTQVPPHHAERLAQFARARSRKVPVDVAVVPGVNHLLVPATTGEIDEYGLLTDRRVSPALTSAIATWMARVLG